MRVEEGEARGSLPGPGLLCSLKKTVTEMNASVAHRPEIKETVLVPSESLGRVRELFPQPASLQVTLPPSQVMTGTGVATVRDPWKGPAVQVLTFNRGTEPHGLCPAVSFLTLPSCLCASADIHFISKLKEMIITNENEIADQEGIGMWL